MAARGLPFAVAPPPCRSKDRPSVSGAGSGPARAGPAGCVGGFPEPRARESPSLPACGAAARGSGRAGSSPAARKSPRRELPRPCLPPAGLCWLGWASVARDPASALTTLGKHTHADIQRRRKGAQCASAGAEPGPTFRRLKRKRRVSPSTSPLRNQPS